MIDELLEMFERDGRENRQNTGERRGIRGMFGRMFSPG